MESAGWARKHLQHERRWRCVLSREHAAVFVDAFLADYESRRWFFSYEPRFVWDGDIEKSVWQRARIGIAPYLANYNQLNTWLMFQVDHHPAKHDHFVATPLIRFFYKTYLFEIGYQSDHHVMVNWTLQF
jgi:hypothetical protein